MWKLVLGIVAIAAIHLAFVAYLRIEKEVGVPIAAVTPQVPPAAPITAPPALDEAPPESAEADPAAPILRRPAAALKRPRMLIGRSNASPRKRPVFTPESLDLHAVVITYPGPPLISECERRSNPALFAAAPSGRSRWVVIRTTDPSIN